MSVDGVHYLSLGQARERYAQTTAEFDVAKQRLAEAVAMGDLRENAEYDVAKDAVGRLARELDALQPVLSMPAVRANDSVLVIQEGCVIELIIHSLTQNPITPGSEEFNKLKRATESGQLTPAFHGLLAYGATMSFHELLVDNILSADTEIGAFLLGKPTGDYSVEVAGGFSNLTVTKVYDVETASILYCELNGDRHVET